MSTMSAITVAIAHPEETTRAACLRILGPEQGIQVIAEARSSLDALADAVRFNPRILLLDISMSKINGIALLPTLREKSPQTKVILLARRPSQARIMEALSHGAVGYLKGKDIKIFLSKAVRRVDAGEAWVPRKMVAKIVKHLVRLTAPRSTRKKRPR